MEELRTTEILDREILNDARKKAHKILRTADETLQSQTKSWEKKTLKAVKSIQKSYAEKIKKNEDEILARLPLDKRRLRSETAEAFLHKAMDEFLKSLGREKLLAILGKELEERLEASFTDGSFSPDGEENPEIIFSGMSAEETGGLLEKALAGTCRRARPLASGQAGFPSGKINKKDWVFREDNHISIFPSVIINTKNLKIRASVEDAAANLLKEKRAELASALLGEEVLND